MVNKMSISPLHFISWLFVESSVHLPILLEGGEKITDMIDRSFLLWQPLGFIEVDFLWSVQWNQIIIEDAHQDPFFSTELRADIVSI